VATAMAYETGPSAIRYPRGAALGVAMDGEPTALPLGKSRTLRQGDHLALLAVGSMVQSTMKAAAELEKQGIEAEVVDMRFIKPLDEEALADIWHRHRLVLTIEENVLAGGFGAAVLEWAADRLSSEGPQVLRLGIPDEWQDQASRAELLAMAGLDAESITRRAADAWQRLDSRGSEQSVS